MGMTKLALATDLSLPINAATETFAFIGRKGSGKSYGAGKLAELLIDAGVQIVVLDTVGNWHGLRLSANGKSPGIEIPFLGGLRGDIPLESSGGALIADVLVDSGRSLVVDISQFSKADRQRFAHAFGQQLWKRKKAEMQPTPIHLFLEEAQLIVPEQVRGDTAGMVGIYEEIIRLGRNYGIGVSMLSQRPQSVNKEVLNQTECLLVFQVNGAHERKALREWIVHQGMDVKLLDELPSLKPGDCYVWSPQWLRILKKIHIAPKRTFDSTATPKVGSTPVCAREMKPINLEDLVAKMSATIERAAADDPRLLRARIAELQRELGAAKKSQQPDPKELESLLGSTRRRGLIDGYDKALHDIAGEISVPKYLEQLESAAAEMKALNKALQKTLHAEPALVAKAEKPAQIIPKLFQTERIPKRLGSRGNGASSGFSGALPIGERRSLIAIAQHPNGVTRTQLTVLTGYKRSTRDAYIQRMREKNLVALEGNRIVATEGGIAAIGSEFEPLPTGEPLREYWLGRLPDGERKVLQIMVDQYPAAVSRETISEATGYARSSRDAYIQRLRAKELVDTSGRAEVRASDSLFGVS